MRRHAFDQGWLDHAIWIKNEPSFGSNKCEVHTWLSFRCLNYLNALLRRYPLFYLTFRCRRISRVPWSITCSSTVAFSAELLGSHRFWKVAKLEISQDEKFHTNGRASAERNELYIKRNMKTNPISAALCYGGDGGDNGGGGGGGQKDWKFVIFMQFYSIGILMPCSIGNTI